MVAAGTMVLNPNSLAPFLKKPITTEELLLNITGPSPYSIYKVLIFLHLKRKPIIRL
jgi:hypothetical protein